jgi:hypothetical protein
MLLRSAILKYSAVAELTMPEVVFGKCASGMGFETTLEFKRLFLISEDDGCFAR